jgi:hypothetical protein
MAGAERIKVFTLVVDGSNLDLIIDRRVNIPLYRPLLFKTIKTGGNSSLKSEKQLESVSFSSTLTRPFEKTSFTVLPETILTFIHIANKYVELTTSKRPLLPSK